MENIEYKNLEKLKNMIVMIIHYYLKVNIQIEKRMEWVKNMMKTGI